MRGFRNKHTCKGSSVSSRGFSLFEVALAIAIVSLITISMVGWQIGEYRDAKVREIATTLVAIDVAYYQVDTILKNINPSYNIPVSNIGNNTTSSTSDTGFVCSIRNTGSWTGLSSYAGASGVLVNNYLDPRINLYRLANSGYTFTFNVSTSGGVSRLTSITVNGIDSEMSSLLSAMLAGKWNSGRYVLNNGSGYPINPLSFACN